MSPEFLFNTFKQFTNGSIALSTLELIPTSVTKENNDYIFDFILKINKPKSYQLSGLIEEAEKTIHLFCSVLNPDLHDFIEARIDLNGKPEIYLGDDIRQKVEDVLKTITEVKVNNNTGRGGKFVKIKVNYLGFKIDKLSNYGEGGFRVVNMVEPISATYDDEKISVEEGLEIYMECQEESTYNESDWNYLEIDSVFHDMEGFFDYDQLIYTVTWFM